MRITSRGQVTIPQPIREKMGLLPNTEIDFSVEGNKVVLRKVKGAHARGKAMIARMQGKATLKITTDEIMALTRG